MIVNVGYVGGREKFRQGFLPMGQGGGEGVLHRAGASDHFFESSANISNAKGIHTWQGLRTRQC